MGPGGRAARAQAGVSGGGESGQRSRRPPRTHPPAGERPARRPVLGFVLRFVTLWTVALVLFARLPGIERWAIRGTLASLLALVRALGISASAAGTFLEVGGVNLQIVADCTPLMPTAGLWAAMIAFPAPPRWKLAGVVVGGAAVWAFNLARILGLIAVLRWWPAAFDFVHVYLWQTITLLVVCGLFLLWLRLQPGRPASP